MDDYQPLSARQGDFFDATPQPGLRVLACLRPDPAVRDRIAEASSAWLAGTETTRPDRLHLTLTVWPELHPDLLAPLRDRLARIRFSPFELSLVQAQVWAGNRVAVFLPATQEPADLLFAQVRAASRGAGLRGQARSPDLAHVTVSRHAAARGKARALHPIPWRCRGFDLVYSPPYREPYVLIEHFPAGAPGGGA